LGFIQNQAPGSGAGPDTIHFGNRVDEDQSASGWLARSANRRTVSFDPYLFRIKRAKLANAPTNFCLVLRSRRLVRGALLFEVPCRPARLCPANFLLYRTGRFRISDLTQDSFKRLLHAARFESMKDAW